MSRPTWTETHGWRDEAGDSISDATLCRRMGWGVGTVLETDDMPFAITITAIGEHHIMARSPNDGEDIWRLWAAPWRERVDEGGPPSAPGQVPT